MIFGIITCTVTLPLTENQRKDLHMCCHGDCLISICHTSDQRQCVHSGGKMANILPHSQEQAKLLINKGLTKTQLQCPSFTLY